jgi:predicted Zn-dependent peptidase
MTTALLESETKPESVLDRRFRKSVYGNYPLANSPSVQSITNISATDLQQFHKQFYRGDRMIVSIVGDVSKTEADQIVVKHGVTIIGLSNLPAMVAADASALYARNILDFMKLIVTKEGGLAIPTDDDIVTACLMCQDGKVNRTNA